MVKVTTSEVTYTTNPIHHFVVKPQCNDLHNISGDMEIDGIKELWLFLPLHVMFHAIKES